ncbi:MAG TPA: hypothetical protein DCP51_02940 [Clostridiales bacterium]|nr:hypothetical protein [Clostridiales bacterium]
MICDDYFKAYIKVEFFDTAISFQTLHHFQPDKKLDLFIKLYSALKASGQYIEVDYLACCDEEEEILFYACEKKRKAENIADDIFVHFDTPLTAEH